MTGSREARLDEPVRVPGYELADRIGAGGFGEVFRARHTLMGRDVAIKVLHRRYSSDPEAIARFVVEARTVSRISHPGIVDVFDFGTLGDGRQYCVMELIRGTTLRDVLRARTRLPIDEALPILRAIAEAVDAAHGARIAHRDLKPDNVFVVDGGGIKLIDFGLAKLTTEEVAVTQTGSAFGTPLYMSPEQCRGKAVDTRTDAYSFGVLAYHVLTGELPFTGDALEIALHHLNDAPDPPSQRFAELSDRVDRVVLALLAKDPIDRPSPLTAAIDAIVGDAMLPARPRRSRRAWAVVALALAAGSIGGGLAWQRGCVAPIADDDYVPAEDRLAGVWDAPTRASIEARFRAVDRADVPGSWKMVARDLDDYADRWATQWDAACRSSDRKTDPLLYAQRQTCLENALLELRAFNQSLATVDIGQLVEGITADFVAANTAVLDDCENVTILREQRPAPPADKQAEIAALGEEWRLARAQYRMGGNAGKFEEVDAGLARMAKVGDRLEAIGASGADESTWLASYLVNQSGGETRWIPAARAAIDTAIRRAEQAHDDGVLANALRERARIQLIARDPTAEIEATIARADVALGRGGRTKHANLDLARAELQLRERQLDKAVGTLRASVDQARDPNGNTRLFLVNVLSRLGRHDEAIAEARANVTFQVSSLGQTHLRVAAARFDMQRALHRAGRVDESLAELDRIAAIYARLGNVAPLFFKEVRMRQLIEAVASGRTEIAVMAAAAAVRGENSADASPLTESERLQLVDRGMASGALELVRDALGQLGSAPTSGGEDWLAYHAFTAGDATSMKLHAGRVTPPRPGPEVTIASLRGAPWYQAIAEASAGQRAEAEARLSALAPMHANPDPTVLANVYLMEGWVLSALGRWADARTAFEQARGLWGGRDWSMGETEAWLGTAQLELGEPAAAIDSFEHSLDVLFDCCDGFHYFAPMAELGLARALWETGGDKQRAHDLAAQARDHYARLGRFKEPDRQRAIRWLEVHPVR